MPVDTRTGRPLRAVAVLGLGLGVWAVLRLPGLHDAAAQAVAGAPGATRQAAAPAGIVTVAANTSASPSANADVAAAELAVAEAELNVARARLALLRLRSGMAAPAAPGLAAPVPVAALPAAGSQASLWRGHPAVAQHSYHAAVSPMPQPPAESPLPQLASQAPSPQPPAASAGVAADADLATQAYARLAAGDRRAAAGLFDAAIAAAPVSEPRRAAWTAERRRLGRRLTGDFYSLFRDGPAGGPAASPVLGGGQSGGSIAWSPDPLARRPFAIVARVNAASASNGAIDNSTAQGAIGVRWTALKGVNISAERLVSLGEFARDDWALRLAAGADGKRGRIGWSSYGEAGIIGNGDVFAGVQARAGVPVLRLGKLSLLAGAGAWGSVQTGGITVSRFDLGPSLIARAPIGRANFELSADWRFRLAGNALPGSGPAVTISAGY
ncbi:MAG: hypothetical protein ACOYLS_12315 [Polymorphobacter sp.]